MIIIEDGRKAQEYDRSLINGDYYLFSAIISSTASNTAELINSPRSWDPDSAIPKMVL